MVRMENYLIRLGIYVARSHHQLIINTTFRLQSKVRIHHTHTRTHRYTLLSSTRENLE